MMATCSNCKHLESRDDYAFPNCGKITHGGKPYVPGDRTPFIHRESRSGPALLLIEHPESFGCTLHEPRPAEPKLPDEVWAAFRPETGELYLSHGKHPIFGTSKESAVDLAELAAGRHVAAGLRFARVK